MEIGMGWIDSHCHLDFAEFCQPAELYARLKEAGCGGVLVPAISAQYFPRLLAFKESFAGGNSSFVNIALGMHPYFLSEHQEQQLPLLDEYLASARPLAVGEIGLDFALEAHGFASQLWWFEQQVRLAMKHQLPIVVHCRKAHDQLACVLRRLKFRHGGIIHAFSGSSQQAHKYLQLGFVLGLGGALTYDRAKAMHRMVAALPAHGYVLETDSPDMPPAFARHEINSPLNIPKIAECIAQLRGEPRQRVYADSTQNFMRAMQLSA